MREDNIRNKVVIQHRAWNLSDVFLSDEDIRPGIYASRRVVSVQVDLTSG